MSTFDDINVSKGFIHPAVVRRFAIGRTIRTLRDQSDYSQEELAALLGVSRQHLSNIERGRGRFQVDILLALPKILDVNFSRIAQEYERQLALLQIPAVLPPAQLRYQTKCLKTACAAVTITVALD